MHSPSASSIGYTFVLLFNPFTPSPFFGQVQKFFFRKFIASLVFILERYIKRLFFFFFFFFFWKRLRTFFHIEVKKLENPVRNEIFRQMSLTSTLALDVPVRPVDAKGLEQKKENFYLRQNEVLRKLYFR